MHSLIYNNGSLISYIKGTFVTTGVKPAGSTWARNPIVSQHAQQRGSSADCRGCCGFQTLPREAWTMNIHAIRGSADDSYRYNPWRAPGTAPVRATPRVCSKQLHLPTDAA